MNCWAKVVTTQHLYNTYFRHQSLDYMPEGLDDWVNNRPTLPHDNNYHNKSKTIPSPATMVLRGFLYFHMAR